MTFTVTRPPVGTHREPGEAEHTPRLRGLPRPDFGPVDTARDWVLTAVIALLALVTRFWSLDKVTDRGTPIFDEKHYAPQSFQISRLGIEENPGYGLVVHPPVAKQIQSFGAWLFDYSPMGWRFTAALAGAVVVVLVFRLARRLSRSTQVGTIAALLLLVDGVHFVTSRVGMLDIYLVLFVVAAAACLAVDHDRMRERMHRAAAAGRVAVNDLGPRLGFRWWRFAAGVMLGMAVGVKWSGLYFVAFFGILTVALDLTLRLRYHVRRPLLGTLLRDCIPAFASIVIVPVVVHVLVWLPWFADENSVYRHATDEGGGANALSSWWYYQSSVMDFHSSLTNSAGHTHPWESKPLTWPMGLRPMLYYIDQSEEVTGCAAEECVSAVMLLGNPVIWWAAIPVLGWALWRGLACRDGRYAFALTGYAAGFVPWLFTYDRQMYFFYAAVMIPFFCILIALALGEILAGARSRTGHMVRTAAISVYLALAVAAFIFFWPILVGEVITTYEWSQRLWLPSWR